MAHVDRDQAEKRWGDRRVVALVLQGGGARGAYEVGVYEAMCEAGLEPEWVSGISSGAINAAVIAGNHPGRRLEKLRRYWELMEAPCDLSEVLPEPLVDPHKALSAMTTMLGKPGFYWPRPILPFLARPGTDAAVSLYDPWPLEQTLEEVVDFDVLNGPEEERVFAFLGYTDVMAGKLKFFDNNPGAISAGARRLTLDHLMASAAMPPGAPAVRIGGRLCWDGGVVANTPLEALGDVFGGEAFVGRRLLIFSVDLFSAAGKEEPTDLPSVLWRQTQIEYAARSEGAHVSFARALRETTDAMEDKLEGRAAPTVTVRLQYEDTVSPLPWAPTDFTRDSLQERMRRGREDTKRAIEEKKSEWSELVRREHGGPAFQAFRGGAQVAGFDPLEQGVAVAGR